MKCICGGTVVDADSELVCGSCGVVIGYEVEMPRTPSPTCQILGYDGGLATVIDRRSVDHAGRALARPEAARRMLRRSWWTQKHNRTMPVAMAQLSALRDTLAMPGACAEYAAHIFRKAAASGFLVGRVTTHCTAAAALLACRRHGLNRTLVDVMNATGLSRRDVYRTYRQLLEKFDPKLPVPDPAAHIARIGGAANVSETTRRDAQAILASMDRMDIAGKDPVGLAAGVLYLSCVRRGEPVLRREIAEAAGVAETTLSSRFNALAGPATL